MTETTIEYGTACGHAKLTEDQARIIHRLRAEGVEPVELAVQFGVDSSTICRLLDGRSWPHILREMGGVVVQRKTIADHAADILRETANPGVMWGDNGLLDMISVRAGMEDRPGLVGMAVIDDVHNRVMNALERSSLFTKRVYAGMNGRRQRAFYLKGQEP